MPDALAFTTLLTPAHLTGTAAAEGECAKGIRGSSSCRVILKRPQNSPIILEVRNTSSYIPGVEVHAATRMRFRVANLQFIQRDSSLKLEVVDVIISHRIRNSTTVEKCTH